MPRKPRFYLPGVPVHIVQKGNNREAIFFEESDYSAYLGWLKDALKRYDCQLHAYVLMTNHVHLLVTPKAQESISRMMQYIGRRYVPYINHKYNRTGTLWEGRYKSSLVQEEPYLLACMRYIELNPVRANMVKEASAYQWSSYTFNALGRHDGLLTAHPLYLALGMDKTLVCQAYQQLFMAHMADNTTGEIRAAWQTGTPLANDRFKEKIERVLNTNVGYAKRGRPKKGSDPF
ncbi:MAG: transposase [Methylococcales bacterium]|nr:transposase [Methylococcales bacterium]